jgi:hypothetical protein
MRTKALCLAILSALLLSACGGSAWTDFASAGGRFSVTAPGGFTEETQTIPTGAGDIEMHIFTLDQGDVGYFVGYFDVPAELLALGNTAALLDGGVQGAFGNVGGSIESQKEITLDGHPGREATGSFSFEGEAGTLKARAYLVNDRIYMVFAGARSGQGNLTDTDRFLDSFKLTSP